MDQSRSNKGVDIFLLFDNVLPTSEYLKLGDIFFLTNKISIILYGIASIALYKLFQDSIPLKSFLLVKFHLTMLELLITKFLIATSFALSLTLVLNNSLHSYKITPDTINKKSFWFALAILISYTADYFTTT